MQIGDTVVLKWSDGSSNNTKVFGFSSREVTVTAHGLPRKTFSRRRLTKTGPNSWEAHFLVGP